MRKTIILAALALFLMSIVGVFAEQAEEPFGTTINVGGAGACEVPQIYKDHTARIWEPNDQTMYTATEYGSRIQNVHGYTGWEVPLRQNYAFQGETLKYFLIVQEANGVDDLDYVGVLFNGLEVARCANVPEFSDISAFIGDNGKMISSYDPATMKSYVCTIIVQSVWVGLSEIQFRAVDKCGPNVVDSLQSDFIYFNPSLDLTMSGPVIFGATTAGSTAMSNTVYVSNNAAAGSGVVMDMYIAADDYFTDPINNDAICGEGNGIKYDRFGFYATKGSINSGGNDNSYPGLGEKAVGLCVAGADEFTPLPSNSGHIEDMCRVINHNEYASLLAEGADMSLTFQLDVPTPCTGSFTDGEFHIVGRVI